MNANVRPDAIRPAPWWLFVLLVAAKTVMSVLGNYWFVPSRVWEPLYVQSHGLVHPTLLGNVAIFIVVICGVLLWTGRRTPAELGIEPRKIPTGVIYTCVLWIVMQLVLAGLYVGFGKPLAIANGWIGLDVLKKVGSLLGQLLGNALCEEILFRGFLLMQCLLLFRSMWPHRPTRALMAAFCLAAAIFAVAHLPVQLRPGVYASLSKLGWDQVRIFVGACVYGWIYWQTRNLFFTVGVHALANVPTTLFAGHNLGPLTHPDVIGAVKFVLVISITAAWHRLPATNWRADNYPFRG